MGVYRCIGSVDVIVACRNACVFVFVLCEEIDLLAGYVYRYMSM